MKAREAPLISVRGLGKRFGARWVVRDLSFTLMPGVILGLVGANGGGKTTTLRMLAGLTRPDEGEGSVWGRDIYRLDPRARRDIGYMSQRLSLYPELTVRENLAFRGALLPPPSRPTIDLAIERYGLSEVLDTRFDRLSGGWARRAQFAAVTLHSPRILLLDEPTAGLDVLTRQMIWHWLSELADAGHGVIISTHDLAEAERCAYILHYTDGRLNGPMPPAALVVEAGAASLEDAVIRLAARR
ncbi:MULTISPECIES: ABC transporter ATP-binding protein [Sphingomonadaceae]|jgi:ABC-2 type transport system ATP-binding protein|uniref:ABC transporter ATP-binding protein n=1 Tax=Sphingomonadales TaxID=204457 RepID=UPI0012BB1E45|nr:ABC transporter ATP-binding protein [Sphingobium sp. CAP-1]QGP77854.1 ATP-binding cassette domain-containing protein [Sphingobium sp. CAP-1]